MSRNAGECLRRKNAHEKRRARPQTRRAFVVDRDFMSAVYLACYPGGGLETALGGGGLRGVRGNEVVHAGEKVFRKQRLETEDNVQAFVLIFGLGHSADDEDGQVGLEFAEAGDELRAGHAGHEVVGEDEIDGLGEVVVAKLLECAFRAEDCDDKVACTLEDGLTSGGLYSVVVDEQDGCGHWYLAVIREIADLDMRCQPAKVW